MKMTSEEYKKYVAESAPKSTLAKDTVMAFLIGGLICLFGQAVSNLFKEAGLDKIDTGSATAITMVFLGALLTGLRVYGSIAKYGGAGTIVPITGFANAIVSPAMEFKSEGFILGLGAKMFQIAGPVLVYGISSSIIYGIILLLFNLE